MVISYVFKTFVFSRVFWVPFDISFFTSRHPALRLREWHAIAYTETKKLVAWLQSFLHYLKIRSSLDSYPLSAGDYSKYGSQIQLSKFTLLLSSGSNRKNEIRCRNVIALSFQMFWICIAAGWRWCVCLLSTPTCKIFMHASLER